MLWTNARWICELKKGTEFFRLLDAFICINKEAVKIDSKRYSWGFNIAQLLRR